MIPLQRPYLGREELDAVEKIFDSRWLGMGSATKEFEDEIGKLLEVEHVVAVNTGTSALHLALLSLGLQPGDEVIVPSLTFVSSVQVISLAGARPVFCDVSLETLNLEVDDVARRLTPRTRAIMPVHYGGLAVDMDALLDLAREHNLTVLEDAAHAFGSRCRGRLIGSFGDITCFSFDPIKNITCGEGGAIVTSNPTLAKQATVQRIVGINNDTWARYRNQRNWFYEVVAPGYRYHLPNINAAIGLAQLKRLDEFRARKQEIVETYDRAFKDLEGLALVRHDLPDMFPFFYVARVLHGRRDEFMAAMKEHGVATGVHYIPNHLQPLFQDFTASLPNTERLYDEIVTLPLFYEMSDEQVDQVIDRVTAFFSRR